MGTEETRTRSTGRARSRSGLDAECEGLVVHVDELAILDILRVVDAPGLHVPGVAAAEHHRVAVGHEPGGASLVELDHHPPLHDDGHVVARVRVGRLLGAGTPPLQHRLIQSGVPCGRPRSPTRKRCTATPTATTSPTASEPSTSGRPHTPYSPRTMARWR